MGYALLLCQLTEPHVIQVYHHAGCCVQAIATGVPHKCAANCGVDMTTDQMRDEINNFELLVLGYRQENVDQARLRLNPNSLASSC
jgi:hypothetical protein